MEAWKDRVIHAEEVAGLYNDKLGEWLLIEVLKTGNSGKAELFKLLDHSRDKDELYDLMMDDEKWDWDKKYIFIYADPERICEL